MPPNRRASPKMPDRLPRPNPAKQRLLAIVAEFFCLTSEDAAALLRDRPPTPSDRRSVRRTLAILHRDGFLRRAAFLPAGRERGNPSYAYGLTKKGVSHAFSNGYATPATKTLDDRSLRTLEHELEVTAFHVALRALCLRYGLAYGWRQRDLKHTVHPDALFWVESPVEPGKGFCYFLEVERQKLGNYRDGEPQVLRKLRAYYRYFNSTDCEREWGFRQYRVLVVQRTDARREGLLKAIRKECSHRMFCLATEAECRDDLGGAILRTPKDAEAARFPFLPEG